MVKKYNSLLEDKEVHKDAAAKFLKRKGQKASWVDSYPTVFRKMHRKRKEIKRETNTVEFTDSQKDWLAKNYSKGTTIFGNLPGGKRK